MPQPGHATIVAYLALFVALGGGAYAALNVTSGDIVNQTIKGKDVKPNALTGKQVNEGKLALPQIRAGVGDESAVPAEVILQYPKLGIRIETDGENDGDEALVVVRNTGSSGDINFVTSESGGSTTLGPGATNTFSGTNRVVDLIAGRYTAALPTRALHINCGFPVGERTFCVGTDVKP